MKNTIMKKNIFSKLALIAAISLTGSHINAAHCNNSNKDKITTLKKTFSAVENYLAEFVSIKSKTPFNEFIIRLQGKLQNLQRNIEESTRNQNNELSKEIDELMDYSLHQFTILYNVFKKYNGKSENQVFSFAGEIKKEFDTDKIFSTMVRKLKALKGKAEHEGDKTLIEEIANLINEIEKKIKVWNAKGNMDLITGLAHRMKC